MVLYWDMKVHEVEVLVFLIVEGKLNWRGKYCSDVRKIGFIQDIITRNVVFTDNMQFIHVIISLLIQIKA